MLTNLEVRKLEKSSSRLSKNSEPGVKHFEKRGVLLESENGEEDKMILNEWKNGFKTR